MMPPASSESKCSSYLFRIWLLKTPWYQETTDNEDIREEVEKNFR